MRSVIITIAIVSLFVCSQAANAEDLSIRLVTASNQNSPSSGALSDVIDLLKGSLAFKSYSLRASASLSLPTSGSTKALDGYAVTCNGSQKQLKIVVRRGDDILLNTTVSLRTGKPLILGGFPEGKSRLVLIFVAR